MLLVEAWTGRWFQNSDMLKCGKIHILVETLAYALHQRRLVLNRPGGSLPPGTQFGRPLCVDQCSRKRSLLKTGASAGLQTLYGSVPADLTRHLFSLSSLSLPTHSAFIHHSKCWAVSFVCFHYSMPSCISSHFFL